MVTRLYKSIAACRRSRAFAAILVPAFLLATLPHAACICADGHKEPSCNAAACTALAHGKDTGVCCGCSCCKPGDDGKLRACCKSKHRPAEPAKAPESGLSAKTGSCCHPIVEAPAPTVNAKKGELPSQKNLVFRALPTLPFISVLLTRSTNSPLDNHHGPPPLDAVIVFLHLTI
jgi:hypothetical protein